IGFLPSGFQPGEAGIGFIFGAASPERPGTSPAGDQGRLRRRSPERRRAEATAENRPFLPLVLVRTVMVSIRLRLVPTLKSDFLPKGEVPRQSPLPNPIQSPHVSLAG